MVYLVPKPGKNNTGPYYNLHKCVWEDGGSKSIYVGYVGKQKLSKAELQDIEAELEGVEGEAAVKAEGKKVLKEVKGESTTQTALPEITVAEQEAHETTIDKGTYGTFTINVQRRDGENTRIVIEGTEMDGTSYVDLDNYKDGQIRFDKLSYPRVKGEKITGINIPAGKEETIENDIQTVRENANTYHDQYITRERAKPLKLVARTKGVKISPDMYSQETVVRPNKDLEEMSEEQREAWEEVQDILRHSGNSVQDIRRGVGHYPRADAFNIEEGEEIDVANAQEKITSEMREKHEKAVQRQKKRERKREKRRNTVESMEIVREDPLEGASMSGTKYVIKHEGKTYHVRQGHLDSSYGEVRGGDWVPISKIEEDVDSETASLLWEKIEEN